MKYPPNWIVTIVSRMTPAMLRDASVMRTRSPSLESWRACSPHAPPTRRWLRLLLIDSSGIRLWILILSMAADRKASDADRGTQQGHRRPGADDQVLPARGSAARRRAQQPEPGVVWRGARSPAPPDPRPGRPRPGPGGAGEGDPGVTRRGRRTAARTDR